MYAPSALNSRRREEGKLSSGFALFAEARCFWAFSGSAKFELIADSYQQLVRSSQKPRAIVIVRDGTAKRGQEYIGPLVVLSGQEYVQMSFPELYSRICDALRGERPRIVGEFARGDGSARLFFEDGSTENISGE